MAKMGGGGNLGYWMLQSFPYCKIKDAVDVIISCCFYPVSLLFKEMVLQCILPLTVMAIEEHKNHLFGPALRCINVICRSELDASKEDLTKETLGLFHKILSVLNDVDPNSNQI